MEIIGYIHICQKGEWRKILKMLLNCIKKNKLYDNLKVIRLGIVNDNGIIINDDILKDEKFEIIYVGKSEEYERPTLLHMRKKAEEDSINTNYFYLHTKGIKHFGKGNEQQIIDWINLMLFWNIEKWELAIEKLKVYDTYGCNDYKTHYSGNFWWAKCSHIKKLPIAIGFGIQNPIQAQEFAKLKVDGVVIGSAIVKEMSENIATESMLDNALETVKNFARNINL
jgi:hypothetical protein